MRKSKLLKIVGIGMIGTAAALGTYALMPLEYNTESKQSQEMRGLEQVPTKILGAIGEGIADPLREFAQDYKAHPEKYNNLMEKPDPQGKNLDTCLKIFAENYKRPEVKN